jgi:hypoxanthine-DNA glycosylase
MLILKTSFGELSTPYSILHSTQTITTGSPFIKEKGIGLWDVLKSCDREGSLDSNIKNEKANDFRSLFKTFPNIHCVLFNGAKAYELFRKGVGFDRFGFITFERLPSTSPANAQRFEQKLSEWNILLNYINKKGGLEA